MVLELHVWGPAFGLPSIEPDCLAAVAYFARAVPRGEWGFGGGLGGGRAWDECVRLMTLDLRRAYPSRDLLRCFRGRGVLIIKLLTYVFRIGELPALRDGQTVVGGYQGIVEYLRRISEGEWDLDGALTPLQRADCLAFSTLLTTHALSLLDLSLYVSTQNYTIATRPAYSSLLPFPTTWLLPPKRRTRAKLRTAHLNLLALDLDSVLPDSNTSKPPPGSAESHIPPSLQTSKPSVSSLVRTPETSSAIRLEALTDVVLHPLSSLLRQSRANDGERAGGSYFLSPNPTSLDCLALGYLSLFLLPVLPIPFLATTLKTKYPSLADYVRRGVAECFGESTQQPEAPRSDSARRGDDGDNDVEAGSASEGEELSLYTNIHIGGSLPAPPSSAHLPWRTAEPLPPLLAMNSTLKEVVGGIPLLGGMLKPDPILRQGGEHTSTSRDLATGSVGGVARVPLVMGVVGVVAAAVGAGVWGVAQGWPDGTVGRSGGGRLDDLGETGDLLGLGRGRGRREDGGGGVGVGVGVGIDG